MQLVVWYLEMQKNINQQESSNLEEINLNLSFSFFVTCLVDLWLTDYLSSIIVLHSPV